MDKEEREENLLLTILEDEDKSRRGNSSEGEKEVDSDNLHVTNVKVKKIMY